MFQQNGYQGYVLKPRLLRSGEEFVYDKVFERFTIEVKFHNFIYIYV